ncbi:hypothetical protein KEM55_005586 [Ascosphaera atra]|nr:hypothetical protein KEM55_005586 [Ascosphaera atra]
MQLLSLDTQEAQVTQETQGMAREPVDNVSDEAEATQASNRWTFEEEEVLLDSPIESKKEGLCDGASFKPEAWSAAVKAMREKTGDRNFQCKRCENKHQAFKKEWSEWQDFLKAISGWTATHKGTYKSPASVTEEFFLAHPKYGKFRYRSIRHADKLAELFEGNLATGEDAASIRTVVGRIRSGEDDAEAEAAASLPSPLPAPTSNPLATPARASAVTPSSQTPQTPSAPPRGRKRRATGPPDDDFGSQLDMVREAFGGALKQALAPGESVVQRACRLFQRKKDELFPESMKVGRRVLPPSAARVVHVLSNDERDAQAFLASQGDEWDIETRQCTFTLFLEKHNLMVDLEMAQL